VGFRVDDWQTPAIPEGDLVAEATWTGDCATTIVVDCTDHTTFRLYGSGVASPSPSTPAGGAGGSSPAATSAPVAGTADPAASATPSSTDEPGSDATCVGSDCGGLPLVPLVAAGLIGIVGVGSLLWIRTMGKRQVIPKRIEPPNLDGSAGPDPGVDSLSLDDAGIDVGGGADIAAPDDRFAIGDRAGIEPPPRGEAGGRLPPAGS
jgi:hypothetical protein